ncbi:MAG: glycosyltransferase family 2 protein [bacterium]|nr:glycosyltransferase family 2 protein [bacterium]
MAHDRPLVTISILSYNDEETIEAAVKSAALQLYPAIEILVLDNNSQDGTRQILKNLRDRLPGLRAAHLREHGKESSIFRCHVLESSENLGFAKGHNKLISLSQGSLVLLLNSDAGLDDNFISYALPYFERDRKLAAMQGKLYRYDVAAQETVKDAKTRKSVIDTTGLVLFRNRRIINRGQGVPDIGQFENEEEVFGADGAAPLYRKTALEDVKICLGARCEYLDEDFFAYKEDVDIAWRLRLAGWKTLYVPGAIGYHQRGSGESAATSYFKILGERRKLSRFAKYHAFKNQRLMQLKNELPYLLFRDMLRWIPKEFASWFYILFFERFTWKAIGDIFLLLSRMLKKRRMIMKRRSATTKEMARWFV